MENPKTHKMHDQRVYIAVSCTQPAAWKMKEIITKLYPPGRKLPQGVSTFGRREGKGFVTPLGAFRGLLGTRVSLIGYDRVFELGLLAPHRTYTEWQIQSRLNASPQS